MLEDPSIFKIGVAPSDDAKYLWNDYAVRVNGVLDLRHLAVLNQEKPEGLASLAERHLNVRIYNFKIISLRLLSKLFLLFLSQFKLQSI